MVEGGYGTVDGPPRRRDSWSIKTIVEEVAGRPISELQDPDKPVHPYLRGKLEPTGSRPNTGASWAPDFEDLDDPVSRVFPPLTGATGRSLHDQSVHHHAETLARHAQEPGRPSPGARPHPPGPSRRPERIYLHYLLLHLDRLSDTALLYLQHAVDEEVDHRSPGVDAPAVRSVAVVALPLTPAEASPQEAAVSPPSPNDSGVRPALPPPS